MVIPVGQQLFFENAVIGQLPIEAETKPFSFVDVFPLERLCVAAIVLTAGCISNVPDRGAASKLTHQRLTLRFVVEPEDFGNGADISNRPQQPRPFGVKRRHSCGKLASILDIQQHSGKQTGNLPRALVGTD